MCDMTENIMAGYYFIINVPKNVFLQSMELVVQNLAII